MGLQELEKSATLGMLATRIGKAALSGTQKAAGFAGKKLTQYSKDGGMRALTADVGKGISTVGAKLTNLSNQKGAFTAAVKNQLGKAKNTFNSYKATLKSTGTNPYTKPSPAKAGLQTVTKFSTKPKV